MKKQMLGTKGLNKISFLYGSFIPKCGWISYRTHEEKRAIAPNKNTKSLPSASLLVPPFWSNPNCWNVRDVGYRAGRCLYNQAS
jgi:hypothetical protein